MWHFGGDTVGFVVNPTWLTAFVDVPADRHGAALAFWCGVTGYDVSAPRGEHGQFVTLLPATDDPQLRVQRIDYGAAGIHLDLHHPEQEFRVLRSPAGFAYCEVSEPLSEPPAPTSWPGGHRSLVDQVCIDVSASRFEEECTFWSERTGCAILEFPTAPEFRALKRPAGQPIRILLQRVEDERPLATGHFDISTDDRAAEASRHQALGATVVREHQWWTVLRDPVGMDYCLVDRTWRD